MNIEELKSFLINELKLGKSPSVSGDGWLERTCFIDGSVSGRFFVGAYSVLQKNSRCFNSFIGRFSVIESDVIVGYHDNKENIFSVHPFAIADMKYIGGGDDYLKKLSSRYYYERNK